MGSRSPSPMVQPVQWGGSWYFEPEVEGCVVIFQVLDIEIQAKCFEVALDLRQT